MITLDDAVEALKDYKDDECVDDLAIVEEFLCQELKAHQVLATLINQLEEMGFGADEWIDGVDLVDFINDQLPILKAALA